MRVFVCFLFVFGGFAAGYGGEGGPAGDGVAAEKEVRISRAEVLRLAGADHVGLLEAMLAYYEKNIKDYTGTFYKHERIKGKLRDQQVIAFKFMDEPFSIAMHWKKNAESGDRLVYVKGANDDQMIVHPTGFWSWIKSVKRAPDCEAALKTNLYPCSLFGVGNLLERMLTLHRAVAKDGEIKIAGVGPGLVDDRKCIVVEAKLPESKASDTRRFVLKIDEEFLLPVEIASYDAKDRLISNYIYKDLKFNVGLKAEQFTAKANKL